MSFDKKLQSLRKTAGLSQEDLANELGVSRQAVSKWESGVSYPEMDKLILMTKLFKCSLDELVNDEIKDSSIMKPKSSKGQTYIDSLLEFINKSINMFTSMKFFNVIKCLIELFVLGFVMVMVSVLIYELLETVIFALIPYSLYGTLKYLGYFLCNIVIIVLVALDVIIFFQFYKIRYLDYYDKLVYQFEVKKEEDKKRDIEVQEELKETKKSIKKTEKIIIRDAEHRPLAWLSTISRGIIWLSKIMLRLFTIPFIILVICSIISLVVSIYLISYNNIFIGISIALVGVIGVTLLIIRTINDDLYKKAYPIRLMSLLFLLFLTIGSVGVGLSFISLKDIKFEVISNKKEITESFKYNDNLYLNILSAADDNAINFIVDDSIDNIEVNVLYDSTFMDFDIVDLSKTNDYILLRRYYQDESDSKETIYTFLNNLKNNVIYDYTYQHYSKISIKASEKNIRKLINNISEKENIIVREYIDGGLKYYNVQDMDLFSDSEVACEFKDYYSKCVEIVNHTDDSNFVYEYRDGKLEYDTSKYRCYFNDYWYSCDNNY